jgi:hypothetical protein
MDDGRTSAEQWLKDLPVTAEAPGFKPEEMLACEKCDRKNPPTRLKCFYCGEQLKAGELQTELAAPVLRQMEPWEKGFNIILTGSAVMPSEKDILAAAQLLRQEPQDIKTVVGKGLPLPLVRTDTLPEAEIIKKRLSESGLDSFIWPDEEAAADVPTRRLRGLEIADETITFLPFNQVNKGGEAQTFRWSELALIVTGSIFSKKISSTEKRIKNEEKQVTESSETSQDEPVIDIFSREDNIGWRVLTAGFDFSCLGAEKSLLAVENIKHLVARIKERAPNITSDDGYLKVRGTLGRVWENEQKLASHKWQRESMGKFHFDKVGVMDNVAQFTRYSRLQWRLLKGR